MSLACCCTQPPKVEDHRGGVVQQANFSSVAPLADEFSEVNEQCISSSFPLKVKESAAPEFRTERKAPPAVHASEEASHAEKAKLRQTVREFSRAAISGFPVNIINDDGFLSETMFQMDNTLEVLMLRPAESDELRFRIKDIAAIYKDAKFVSKAPRLMHLAPVCVGIDAQSEDAQDYRVLFHFRDPTERSRFYTCMQVLRLSVDPKRRGPRHEGKHTVIQFGNSGL